MIALSFPLALVTDTAFNSRTMVVQYVDLTTTDSFVLWTRIPGGVCSWPFLVRASACLQSSELSLFCSSVRTQKQVVSPKRTEKTKEDCLRNCGPLCAH